MLLLQLPYHCHGFRQLSSEGRNLVCSVRVRSLTNPSTRRHITVHPL